MKKLFFFRSSSSDDVNNKTVPSPPTDDEQIHLDKPWEIGENCRVRSKVDNRSGSPIEICSKPRKELLEAPTSGLRRSLSFSSVSFESSGIERNLFSSQNPSASPTNSSNIIHYSDHPVCSHSPPSERLQSKVVDLYIDGEQQQERNLRPKSNSYQRIPTGNGKCSDRLLPKVQSSMSTSPAVSSLEKPRSFSFREMRDSRLRLSTRNEFEEESPRKLARNVVKRLSEVLPRKPKTDSRDFYPDTPTTVEDIFEDYLDRHHVPNSDKVMRSTSPSDCPNGTINEYCEDEISGIQLQSCPVDDVLEGIYSTHTEVDDDSELQKKAKEAMERVTLFSEELEPEDLLQENDFNLSTLIQVIKNLAESRRSLALEVSTQLQCRISERASAKEAVRVAKVELDSQTRRLEMEKAELQSGLEKELDRRSSDWSFKLEKFQIEEQRLRQRVRELAEQNVSLQRKVSSLNGREVEMNSRMKHSELQLKDVMTKLEELSKENQDLQHNLHDVREQFKGVEADQSSIQRNYKEKEKETKELQNAVTRLQRICNEQEKTIGGLRQELSEEIERKQSSKNLDNSASKLQMELVRLTGVEQTLRREVGSYRLEAQHLRHENVNLLDRLRNSGNASGFPFFKLDQELQERVTCLQNQGFLLFSESSRVCVKLLEHLKSKAGQHFASGAGLENGREVNKNSLDGYFLLEADMKVQSLKRGFENLKRSLQTVSSSLHDKSNTALEPRSQILEDSGLVKTNNPALEDNIGLELKVETLLTSLLREKLLASQLEIDQLQAELATAFRGHEILKCETQAAVDALSSVSHKMRDLELQMSRKDESINQLQNELQDCSKELKITKGILPKVSAERDMMWEEVKQYSEQNMLLNSELKSLKKKIEVLDEDILLKEGQITILKDSLQKKPFDILSSPKSLHEFRLD